MKHLDNRNAKVPISSPNELGFSTSGLRFDLPFSEDHWPITLSVSATDRVQYSVQVFN